MADGNLSLKNEQQATAKVAKKGLKIGKKAAKMAGKASAKLGKYAIKFLKWVAVTCGPLVLFLILATGALFIILVGADSESGNTEGSEYGEATEGGSAQETIAFAEKYMGKQLSYFTNIDDTNTFFDADWCAMFMSYVLKKTNSESIAAQTCSASCGSWSLGLDAKNKYHPQGSSYVPKAGDLIFFLESGENGARDWLNHIGMVKSYDKNTKMITTIEGNTGQIVGNGAWHQCSIVNSHTYNISDPGINGFGEVDYSSKGNKYTYTNKNFKDKGLRLPATGKATKMSDRDYNILLRLLYRENGGESFECQVYTCSAILNLWDYNGHKDFKEFTSHKNVFEPADVLDSVTNEQMAIVKPAVDYVLSGGRVAEIKYFRADYYHNFGTPVYSIDNTFYSK